MNIITILLLILIPVVLIVERSHAFGARTNRIRRTVTSGRSNGRVISSVDKETETLETESAVAPPKSGMDFVRTEMQLGMSVGLVVVMVMSSLPWSSSANAGPPVTAPYSTVIANGQQQTSVPDEDFVNAPADGSNGRFVVIESRLDRLEVGGILLAAAAYVEMKKDKAEMKREMKEGKAEIKREMKEDKAEIMKTMKMEVNRLELRTDIKFFVTILAGFAMTWYRTK